MPVQKDTWVDTRRIVLPAGQRSGGIPEDTRGVDLEIRIKGFLTADAEIGDEVVIRTPAGRRVRGILTAENPPYEHHFGSPVPELQAIGTELRAMLADYRNAPGNRDERREAGHE
jgi:hypothetical protein